MKKNVAGQFIGAQLITAADGTPFTGSVTVAVTGDAGTQATGSVGAGACAHEGGGFHTYAPAQAETNYDHVAFTFSGTGAISTTVQVHTLPTTGILAPTTAGRTLVVDSSGLADANVVKLGPTGSGTAQTARDIGGQLDAAVSTRQPTIWAAANSTVNLSGTTVNLVNTATTVTNQLSAATIAAAVEAAILDEGDATALLAAIGAKVEEFLINDGDSTATLAAIAAAVTSALGTGSGLTDLATQASVDTLTTRLGAPADFGGGQSIAENLQDIVGSPTFSSATDSLEAIRDRGDAEWRTATGFSTHSAADVVSALGTGSTLTGIPKTGYKLASDGLDSISTAAPAGVASNFREMVVQAWRRFFKKATKTSTEIKTYADNGTTVITTQTISSSGSNQEQGAAS